MKHFDALHLLFNLDLVTWSRENDLELDLLCLLALV